MLTLSRTGTAGVLELKASPKMSLLRDAGRELKKNVENRRRNEGQFDLATSGNVIPISIEAAL